MWRGRYLKLLRSNLEQLSTLSQPLVTNFWWERCRLVSTHSPRKLAWCSLQVFAPGDWISILVCTSPSHVGRTYLVYMELFEIYGDSRIAHKVSHYSESLVEKQFKGGRKVKKEFRYGYIKVKKPDGVDMLWSTSTVFPNIRRS